jgi:hypothetical protein
MHFFFRVLFEYTLSSCIRGCIDSQDLFEEKVGRVWVEYKYRASGLAVSIEDVDNDMRHCLICRAYGPELPKLSHFPFLQTSKAVI